MTVKQFGAWHDDKILAVWPGSKLFARSQQTNIQLDIYLAK
jgi:hypothetical protein